MSDWTDKRIAELRKRWIAGEASGCIGKALGVTRNAVMSKVHRERLHITHPHPNDLSTAGCAARVKQLAAQARHATAKTAARKPTAVPSAKPDGKRAEPPFVRPVKSSAPMDHPVRANAFDPLPDVPPLPLMNRRPSQCAWPIGEPSRPTDQLCCGAPVASMEAGAPPYCRAHMKLRKGKQVKPIKIGRVA